MFIRRTLFPHITVEEFWTTMMCKSLWFICLCTALLNLHHSRLVGWSSALWLGHCNILIHFFQPFCCKCIAMMGIIVLLNDPFSANRSAQLTLVYRRIHGWLSDCKVPNDQHSSTVLTVALRYLCSYTVLGFLQTRAVHHGQTSLLGLCSRCFVVCLLLPSCSFQREEATCSVFF